MESHVAHGRWVIAHFQSATAGQTDIEHDGVIGVTDTTPLEHVVGKSATRAIRLDADGVVYTIEREVLDQQTADAQPMVNIRWPCRP